jgi:hypothetical protein
MHNFCWCYLQVPIFFKRHETSLTKIKKKNRFQNIKTMSIEMDKNLGLKQSRSLRHCRYKLCSQQPTATLRARRNMIIKKNISCITLFFFEFCKNQVLSDWIFKFILLFWRTNWCLTFIPGILRSILKTILKMVCFSKNQTLLNFHGLLRFFNRKTDNGFVYKAQNA